MTGGCVKARGLAWRGEETRHQAQELGPARGAEKKPDTRPRSWGQPIPSFNFIKGNFHPAPHCPSARIHSSASILKTSNSPKPASNSLEFPSNSPSNSPSPPRKMLSPWGPRMLPSVYLQDMWSAFFVHLKKSWFESHNYSDKGAQARDTFTQPERKTARATLIWPVNKLTHLSSRAPLVTYTRSCIRCGISLQRPSTLW